MWSDVIVKLDAQRHRLKAYGSRRGSPILRPRTETRPDRQQTEDRLVPWVLSVVIVLSSFGIAAATLAAAFAWRM